MFLGDTNHVQGTKHQQTKGCNTVNDRDIVLSQPSVGNQPILSIRQNEVDESFFTLVCSRIDSVVSRYPTLGEWRLAIKCYKHLSRQDLNNIQLLQNELSIEYGDRFITYLLNLTYEI